MTTRLRQHRFFHPPLRLGLLRRVRPQSRDDSLPPTPPAEMAKFLRAYHRAMSWSAADFSLTLEELFAERGLRLEDWPEPPETIYPWELRSRNRLRKPLTRGVPEKHKAKWRNDDEYLFRDPVYAEQLLSAYERAMEWAGKPVPDDVAERLAALRESLGIEPE